MHTFPASWLGTVLVCAAAWSPLCATAESHTISSSPPFARTWSCASGRAHSSTRIQPRARPFALDILSNGNQLIHSTTRSPRRTRPLPLSQLENIPSTWSLALIHSATRNHPLALHHALGHRHLANRKSTGLLDHCHSATRTPRHAQPLPLNLLENIPSTRSLASIHSSTRSHPLSHSHGLGHDCFADLHFAGIFSSTEYAP